MTTKLEFLDAYDRIKTADLFITSCLQEAIEHEEKEEPAEAMASYQQAAQCIDEIFTLPVGLPEDSKDIEIRWLDACSIIKKLKAAKETIEQRLKVLGERDKIDIDHAAEEAREEIHMNGRSEIDLTNAIDGEEPVAKKRSVLLENPEEISDMKNTMEIYKKHVTAIREVLDYSPHKELSPDEEHSRIEEVHFDKIYQAPVKLYKISHNGSVETLAGESIMSLVMCSVKENSSQWHFLNGISFMQCSLPIAAVSSTSSAASTSNVHNYSWIYPLLPDVTACYRTDYGAFVFPDMETASGDIENSAFGIMLSNEISKIDEETFEDMKKFFLDLLEAILAGEIGQLPIAEDGELPREQEVSEKISSGIVKSADFIARTIFRGAEKTSEFIDRNTPYLISRMQSAPPDAKPVPSTLQTTVSTARTVTGVAASATGWVAGKIGAAAYKVGTFLAPHVEAQSVNLMERGFGYQKDDAESKVKGVMTLAAGAIEGVTTVVSGLEKSADVLGKSLSENSVKIISHKYGNSAGDVAAGTFDTIGNSWHINKNIKIFRPKGLAEKVVKTTSKGVVLDYKSSLRGKKNFVTAGELQPELWDIQKEKFD